MEFTQLNYFRTVARLGNVSQAARELYVTQPNLSKSISRLEAELGVPLFEHRKGKIVLNEYGRIFLASVELSFSELATGKQTIQRLYEAQQNVLSLGCSIDDFLPDVLKEFSLTHPEIGIRQFACSPEELSSRLLVRSLDLAITNRVPESELLTAELLGEKEFVILVSREHPLAGERVVSMSQLSGERFICDRSRMDTDTLREVCTACGYEPAVAFEVESTDLIYRLLAGNAGIALMPMAQLTKLGRDYPDNPIVMLRVRESIPSANLYLVYPKGMVFTAAAQLLREFLQDWMNQEEEQLKQFDGAEHGGASDTE